MIPVICAMSLQNQFQVMSIIFCLCFLMFAFDVGDFDVSGL